MEDCISCGAPTSETVHGRIGEREGVLCADCQYWCDGNIVETDPETPES